MPANSAKYLVPVSAFTLPSLAHAQPISPAIAALAVSPVLALLFAVVLGVVARSWRVGAAHAGLVGIWILLFGVASYWVENDYVIWTPLALYGIHAATMVVMIVRGVFRRTRR